MTGDDTHVETLLVAEADAGERLDKLIAAHISALSRARVQGLMREGQVRLGGAVVSEPGRRVKAGDAIEIAIPPAEPAEPAAEDIPLTIVYEDDEVIVIDKPAGLTVHPAPGHPTGTLVNALIAHCGASLSGIGGVRRPGIVHRLDKDTSGLMVVAKTLEAQTDLVRQLQARSVSRVYLAIAEGRIEKSGSVDAPIGRHPTHRTRMAIVERGRPARTHYRPLQSGSGWTLVECTLETGRTHQIRVHLQHIGHPLVGDPVYGKRTSIILRSATAFNRQALHATTLSLEHPASGARMSWSSSPPADFDDLLNALKTACP